MTHTSQGWSSTDHQSITISYTDSGLIICAHFSGRKSLDVVGFCVHFCVHLWRYFNLLHPSSVNCINMLGGDNLRPSFHARGHIILWRQWSLAGLLCCNSMSQQLDPKNVGFRNNAVDYQSQMQWMYVHENCGKVISEPRWSNSLLAQRRSDDVLETETDEWEAVCVTSVSQ